MNYIFCFNQVFLPAAISSLLVEEDTWGKVAYSYLSGGANNTQVWENELPIVSYNTPIRDTYIFIHQVVLPDEWC